MMRWGIVIAVLLAAILIPFALWGESLEQWVDAAGWMQMNPALVALTGAALLAADIVLPLPSSVIGTMLGTILGGWLGTLAGAIGLTVGCVLGYGIGRTVGGPAARRFIGVDTSARAAAWLERYGIVALVVCRAIPVLAEASIVMAGALRLPPAKIFVATTLSNIGISAVYAFIGATATDAWSFLLAFALAMAVPAVGLALAKASERIRPA